MGITVIKGSVVEQSTDAIVNAANCSLLGGGGVDGAIHRAAGPKLLEECRTLGGCQTGDAKITKGYNLKAKYVIHTVGPVYSGKPKDAQLLSSCYKKSMDLALENCCSSIAFCCISTGVYGYPLQEASEIAEQTVKEWFGVHQNAEIDVVFCCFTDKEYEVYKGLCNDFEKQVNEFIDVLKKYEVGENRFNPWKDEDDTDSEGAADTRCENLRQYLINHENAKYILIGESPSTGARYTGIAMTSERIMKKWGKLYKPTSKDKNTYETTATMVWKTIEKYNEKKFVFWNAYAFNAIAKGGKKNFRCGNKEETENNKDILKGFRKLFQNAEIIAVGKKAEDACGKFEIEIKGEIRHPSGGGKSKFVEGLEKLVPNTGSVSYSRVQSKPLED